MARGYGFMAVACWCALSTAASAQYSPQGGQSIQNPALLPSAEYFTALNAGPVQGPMGTPQLAPASQWASPPAAPYPPYQVQPRVASNIRQDVPQPPQPMPNYAGGPMPGNQMPGNQPLAPMADPNNPAAMTDATGGYCTTGTCGSGGWFSSVFNGYGVPVYGGLNQFNRCCPCATTCGTGCATGTGGLFSSGAAAGNGEYWGAGVNNAAPCGSPYAGAMGGAGNCSPTSQWYGNVAALAMWRAGGNRTWTTYNENNNADQLLSTRMANNGGFYGGQITIGSYCGCNHAIEGTYWGFASASGGVSLTDPNNKLGTPFDEGGASIGGRPLGVIGGFNPFDGSHQQSITRTDNVQNFELNFLTFPLSYMPTQRFRLALLSGVRYFRFQDGLVYGGTEFGTNFGDNGGANEAFLNVRTTNNLLGWQIGSRMSYFLTPRFSLFATPKVGIYSNMMAVHSSLYSGNGALGFDATARSTGFAVLGEIDLGGQFYITPQCSVFAAYRLIGVGGVATADTQIPPYMVDTAGFTQLNHNDALILQGVMTGVMWNF